MGTSQSKSIQSQLIDVGNGYCTSGGEAEDMVRDLAKCHLTRVLQTGAGPVGNLTKRMKSSPSSFHQQGDLHIVPDIRSPTHWVTSMMLKCQGVACIAKEQNWACQIHQGINKDGPKKGTLAQHAKRWQNYMGRGKTC